MILKIGRHMPEYAKIAPDSDLIEQARCDPAAFTRLYRRHYNAIFRYCAHRLFDRAAAEDVTSAIFLKVVRNFRGFRGDEQAFQGWLYRIATNEVNTHLRQMVQQRKVLAGAAERLAAGADCAESSPEDHAAKMAALRQAMFALKPRYQTIIALRFFEKMKLSDIAGILGGSPATVRSQLVRALAKLRKHMLAARKNALPEVR